MGPADEIERATACELTTLLSQRKVSARELCEAAIARIEHSDGLINAVVVRDFERARTQADEADRKIAAGEQRPLLGVPMTVKESFDVQGLPTSVGLVSRRDVRARSDAVIVQRLREAGAIILGKTNVSPYLGDWHSDNPVYGRTVHPLDPARTPGGSSGGSAAALGSYMVPLELGSDIAGSIRIPASFCGVYGHKPSYGLVPMRGHVPPGDGADLELGVVGPMARSVSDLARMLGVIAGPDGERAAAYRVSLPPARTLSLRGARVLVLTDHPRATTAAAVRTAIAALAMELAAAGASVATSSPELPDLIVAHRVYRTLLITVTTGGTSVGPDGPVSAQQWFALLDERARIARAWARLFTRFDVVLMPTFGAVAFAHVDDEPSRDRKLIIDGKETRYWDQLAWPGVATLPGLPATALPIGKSPEGLPIGAQLVGPYLEDRTPLALAEAIARLRGV